MPNQLRESWLAEEAETTLASLRCFPRIAAHIPLPSSIIFCCSIQRLSIAFAFSSLRAMVREP